MRSPVITKCKSSKPQSIALAEIAAEVALAWCMRMLPAGLIRWTVLESVMPGEYELDR